MDSPISPPGDSRFFKRQGPFSLKDIVQALGDLYEGEKEELLRAPLFLGGVAPLHSATKDEISFLDNRRYLPLLEKTKAGAVIVSSAFADKVPSTAQAIICKKPYLAWARIATLFHPLPPARSFCHPTAYIGANVEIEENVEIGAFAVIGEGVKIGNGCVIGAHVSIGDYVEIGSLSRIYAHVSISHALLGERVIIHPGARIGQEGFGFALGEDGFETVPQLGRVILEDGVEVGANSTIDRGSMKDTIIGAGSRIDNLVQIGHNVKIGRCCIIVAQAGISGSTELGDFVTLAAQAGLIGHIHIGDKARIGAQSGVMSDIKAGADVIGSPSMPFREYFRNVATLRKFSRK